MKPKHEALQRPGGMERFSPPCTSACCKIAQHMNVIARTPSVIVAGRQALDSRFNVRLSDWRRRENYSVVSLKHCTRHEFRRGCPDP